MAVTKSMADETRVRLLAALGEGEMCVCQLIELIGLAPSTVSKHLSILRSARMIECRKQGRWMYYRIAGDHAPKAPVSAIKWLFENISDTPVIMKDKQRLEQITEKGTEDLCRRQNPGESGKHVKTKRKI